MKVLLLRGRPGVGKTTLASAVASDMNWMVISKDCFYDAIAGSVEDHSLRNKASYQALYNILKINCAANYTVILDFPFQTFSELNIIRSFCVDHSIIFKSVLVSCANESIWAERINQRAKNPLPNQLITNFDVFRKNYESLSILPEEGEYCVDTSCGKDLKTGLVREIVCFMVNDVKIS